MSGLRAIGRRAGLGVGAVGVVAAGAAVGWAAERYAVGRSWRGTADPAAGEPFGVLVGQTRMLAASDGVPLFVEVVEHVEDPELTLVLCHGYSLNLDAWHYQRRDLDDVGRLVLFDQRGHGRSARGPAENATIDQLGDDLHRVITETVPEGPIVLVGHSMGGMTVMAYAEQHPEMFGDRILGVGLIATSPGRIAEVTLGVPAAVARVAHRVAPRALRSLVRQADLVERGRRAGSDLSYVLTKRYSFGGDPPPSLVEFVAEMIAATPFEVVAEFFPAFDAHDKLHALDALCDVESLVLVGSSDVMTPVSHSEEIADRLPRAEFVVVDDAAHMVHLEYPDVVNKHLRALVERSRRAIPTP